MAALVTATADVLTQHMSALDEHDSDARAERVAYGALVAAHRDVAERLEALARQLESNRDLPPAPHTEEVMRDPSGQAAAFDRYLMEQRKLAELLNTTITESMPDGPTR
jgi:hypothetical protein